MSGVRLREDLTPWVFIFLGGIIAAIICFALLDSTAESQSGIPLTGAIVGALVSWSALSNIFLQLRRSNRTTESLQNLNDQLQNKLIRSSPRPVGYEREIDERHGLVLARPEKWEPRGGVLFSFTAPASTADDVFSAELQITQFPVTPDGTQDGFYAEIRRSVSSFVREMDGVQVEETVFIGGGGDRAGIRSAKFTVQTYALVNINPDPRPGEAGHTWTYISKGRVRELVAPFIERALRDARVDSPGAEHLEEFARIRSQVKVRVDSLIESWQIDPREGLTVTVREILQEVLSSPANHLPWASVDVATDEKAETSSEDASHAIDSIQANGMESRERLEVVPVIRMFVTTHYPNLHRAFLFDFVDNVGDFASSTALFNDILGTVRFIE